MQCGWMWRSQVLLGPSLCLWMRKVSGLSSGSIFISSQFSVAQAGSKNSVGLSGHCCTQSNLYWNSDSVWGEGLVSVSSHLSRLISFLFKSPQTTSHLPRRTLLAWVKTVEVSRRKVFGLEMVPLVGRSWDSLSYGKLTAGKEHGY